MLDAPDAVIAKVVTFFQSFHELITVATVGRNWNAVTLNSVDLRYLRGLLARKTCLPSKLLEHVTCLPGRVDRQASNADLDGFDWLEFCSRQLRLQSALSGEYLGCVTPENLPDGHVGDDYNWEEQLTSFAALRPMELKHSRCGRVASKVFVDSEASASIECHYEWLVLDRRRELDSFLWEKVSTRCSEEAPKEVWEDGDLHCGVRGVFDFRPAVDPNFLDLSALTLLLCRSEDFSAEHDFVAWTPRLFAPCVWMLPKRPSMLEQLDHGAAFRQTSTVAALTLGRQIERPVCYDVLEALLANTAVPRERGESWASNDSEGKHAASRRRKGKRACKTTEPKDMRSGRNPKGLNLFVPRPKMSDANPATSSGTRSASVACKRPVPDSYLYCEADAPELPEFLRHHRASMREAEQLCIQAASLHPEEAVALDVNGLTEDATRLEACGALSQSSIVELARKWNCLSGKWLLFVPEWRIDDLFEVAALRLHSGDLGGCIRLVVSPPGAFGTDPNRYMLSAHCSNFTDRQAVMTVGKCLRAVARTGLRAPTGDWGELKDDPFAAPGKKVCLVFKPDVFTRLNLHRNNPYGIKTTLHVIDL